MSGFGPDLLSLLGLATGDRIHTFQPFDIVPNLTFSWADTETETETKAELGSKISDPRSQNWDSVSVSGIRDL